MSKFLACLPGALLKARGRQAQDRLWELKQKRPPPLLRKLPGPWEDGNVSYGPGRRAGAQRASCVPVLSCLHWLFGVM